MQKSLFAKYFAVCGSVILVSITFLGAMLLIFSARYFQNDQYELLASNVQRATSITESTLTQDNVDGGYQLDNSTRSVYDMISNVIGANMFLCNADGQVVYFASTLDKNGQPDGQPTAFSLPRSVIREIVKNGQYRETGSLGGVFDKNYYIIGQPVEADGQTIGYLFAASSSENMQEFLGEILNMFILSSMLVIVLAFVILFMFTSQLVRPLKDMAQVARAYGQGDFTKKVHIQRDDEIGQLAQAMNTMSSDLSIIENSRRSFTANVSHELKTPMTTIAGFIDGILDGTIPPEQEKHYLRIVSAEVKRLSRLVRSMLNLSRIEAGEQKMDCKPFNVIETIAQVLFSFEASINDKHLDIRGLDGDSVWIDGDEDLIHQVVYNLMDNAIKFVNDGGYISFAFHPSGARTEICIRNSGDGLTRDEMDKVFDRFYKTDKSRGLDKNGVGLGLNIVKNIVHLHGGEIVVRSREGEYTEFGITFKSAKPPQKPRKKAQPSQR